MAEQERRGGYSDIDLTDDDDDLPSAHDFGQELRNRERTILNLTNYIWALYKRGDNIGVGIIIRDFDFHLQAQENVNRGQDLAFEPNVQRWLAESRMLFPG